MDKYTTQDQIDNYVWANETAVIVEKNNLHAIFHSKKDAQEYIAWKNQPRIDEYIKQSIINSLIANRDLRYKTKFTTVTKDLDIEIIETAIEIIKNLPSEEN